MGVSIPMLVQRVIIRAKCGEPITAPLLTALVHMLEFHVNIVNRQHKSDLCYGISISQEG